MLLFCGMSAIVGTATNGNIYPEGIMGEINTIWRVSQADGRSGGNFSEEAEQLTKFTNPRLDKMLKMCRRNCNE